MLNICMEPPHAQTPPHPPTLLPGFRFKYACVGAEPNVYKARTVPTIGSVIVFSLSVVLLSMCLLITTAHHPKDVKTFQRRESIRIILMIPFYETIQGHQESEPVRTWSPQQQNNRNNAENRIDRENIPMESVHLEGSRENKSTACNGIDCLLSRSVYLGCYCASLWQT